MIAAVAGLLVVAAEKDANVVPAARRMAMLALCMCVCLMWELGQDDEKEGGRANGNNTKS